LGELAQQLAAAFVLELRHHHLHLDVFVAAHAFVLGGGHAALAHPEALPGLRARRNVQQRLAFDRGYADLGAQRRFGDGEWNLHMDVVRLAREQGMRLDADDHVKIAAAARSPVSLRCDAQPRSLARARLDPDFELLGGLDPPLALAARARRAALARASAHPAAQIELHAAHRLGHLPLAAALRAGAAPPAGARAVALRAAVLARHAEPQHRAPDRLPKADRRLEFEVASHALGGRRLAIEDIREDVAEAGAAASSAARGAAEVGEIESGKIKPRRRRAPGARPRARFCAPGESFGAVLECLVVEKAGAIEELALLRLAQDVVRLLHILELVFGGFVVGVDVGMELARQAPVGLADLLRRRRALDPERLVVVFGRSGHALGLVSHPILSFRPRTRLQSHRWAWRFHCRWPRPRRAPSRHPRPEAAEWKRRLGWRSCTSPRQACGWSA